MNVITRGPTRSIIAIRSLPKTFEPRQYPSSSEAGAANFSKLHALRITRRRRNPCSARLATIHAFSPNATRAHLSLSFAHFSLFFFFSRSLRLPYIYARAFTGLPFVRFARERVLALFRVYGESKSAWEAKRERSFSGGCRCVVQVRGEARRVRINVGSGKMKAAVVNVARWKDCVLPEINFFHWKIIAF